jgi:hypothetical protein
MQCVNPSITRGYCAGVIGQASLIKESGCCRYPGQFARLDRNDPESMVCFSVHGTLDPGQYIFNAGVIGL